MAPSERLELRLVGAEEPTSVEVHANGAVTVESGEAFSVTAFDGGILLVDDGKRAVRAFVAGPPDRPWVFVDGVTWELEVVQDRSIASHRADGGLTAPMPATVVRVVVAVGDAVHKGDVLLVLEAMKMELPIRAPRDGRVMSIRCRQGELVQPGAPLLELE